jgi:hypothetical protein
MSEFVLHDHLIELRHCDLEVARHMHHAGIALELSAAQDARDVPSSITKKRSIAVVADCLNLPQAHLADIRW